MNKDMIKDMMCRCPIMYICPICLHPFYRGDYCEHGWISVYMYRGTEFDFAHKNKKRHMNLITVRISYV